MWTFSEQTQPIVHFISRDGRRCAGEGLGGLSGLQNLLGKLLGGENGGLKAATFTLHLPVGADQGDLASAALHPLQATAQRSVCSLPGGHEMSLNAPIRTRAGPSRGSPVEINLDCVAAHAAEHLQQLDQARFVVHVAQAEAWQLGDEVVSVDQIEHEVIVLESNFL